MLWVHVAPLYLHVDSVACHQEGCESPPPPRPSDRVVVLKNVFHCQKLCCFYLWSHLSVWGSLCVGGRYEGNFVVTHSNLLLTFPRHRLVSGGAYSVTTSRAVCLIETRCAPLYPPDIRTVLIQERGKAENAQRSEEETRQGRKQRRR